jgi:hypothetical protein
MPDPLFHAAAAYDVAYLAHRVRVRIDILWFAIGAAAVDIFMIALPAYFFLGYSFYDFYNICRYATHGILAVLIMSVLVLIGTRHWSSALWFLIGAVVGHWPLDMLSLEGIKMLYPWDPNWAYIHWDVFCQAMTPINQVPPYWECPLIWWELGCFVLSGLIFIYRRRRLGKRIG